MNHKKEIAKREDIKVEIVQIDGDDPRYDAWSITGKAWCDREGEKHCERRITLNILKDDGDLIEDGEGRMPVLDRLKDTYLDIIKEDPEYQDVSIQTLEDEKSKVEKLRGKTFSV